MRKIMSVFLCLLLLTGCGAPALPALPKPEIDTASQFGVDKNINMSTIDEYIGREDVVYRDMRMLFDPADFAAIGGDADLSATITGFKVVPYPYIATLSVLPVANAYEGDCLFDVVWNADGSVASAEAKYQESMFILEELFPKDKPIFLMCGGGGYAGMTKNLLLFLGWSDELLYNVGGNWEYKGKNKLELKVYPEDANDDVIYATWRADYATIDFTRLHEK